MTDPEFTDQEFLEWVRSKDPQEEYNYVQPYSCPMAMFLIETGRAERPCVGPRDWDETDDRGRFIGPTYEFSHKIESALNDYGDSDVHTFGKLAERLQTNLELT
jgi:hypothetical protein